MKRSAMILATTIALLSPVPNASAQCGGEPAADSPCAPRVISGAPGVHGVIMDVSTAVGAFTPACGGSTHGHGVWFQVTPTVSGLLTFSTCHPDTSYDTVVQPWRATADCEFPERLDELCNDDTDDPICVSACQSPTARSSSITFHVAAGTTYLFQVSSYGDNSAGCALCLGVRVTICGGDATPPTCTISDPGPLDCACNPVSVVGTVDDPEGGIQSYTLEYAAADSTTWTEIASGSSSIMSGVLGMWNTSGLPQGLYLLRLTTINACGLSNTAVQNVWVDQALDTLRIDAPQHGDVVGGLVCLAETINDASCLAGYTAEYRPVSSGAFQPVDPAMPTYPAPVINDRIATWDTLALGLPDGDYELRVEGTTICGNAASQSQVITVDNTAPVASIASPGACDYVDGVVQVVGTAEDANLQSWVLQYTGGGGSGWQTLASGSSPVVNDVLATWDTSVLPYCAYALRLVVSERAVLNCNGLSNSRAEYKVTVNVGSCGDFDADDDGDVDVFDFGAFTTAFTGPVP